MSKKWKHDELAADLAAHLRAASDRMVWEDMQMGPAGSPRPDVYTMYKSYSNPKPMAYEVKISVADFRSDITTGKWQKYDKYAGAVVFAVPQGLVTKADLPRGCGLMVRGATGWSTLKAPTFQRVELTYYPMMKLLIDGVARASQRRVPTPRCANEWTIAHRVRQKLGQEVGQYIEDTATAISRLQKVREDIRVAAQELQKINQEVRNIRDEARASAIRDLDKEKEWCAHEIVELRQALGLESTDSRYALKNKLRDVIQMIREDKRVSICDSALDQAIRALTEARNKLEVGGGA